MTRIVWTEPAVSDLNGIHAYIARDAEVYANATVTEILDSVDRLSLFPQSGRIVPEVDDENTREIIVGDYRVMYDTSGEVVRILSVLHGARLFPTP
jgi:toxin ParE1/3/4